MPRGASSSAQSPAQSFQHAGRRISFRSYGSGPRVVVLTHGLLMDGRMFTNLAPALARRGYRVITVDMLGHGESDHPHDMHQHSMTQYGRDVVALLDHLGIDQAVIGGTSLGANVALEVAVASPHRVRALVLEMPVLENGLAAAAAVFVPLAFALRISLRGGRLVSALARKIPRSHFLVDMLIDFARRDPASSLAVLDGITFGRVAPPRDARRLIGHPTLVIGHKSDPVHPFSDADTLARELSDARLVAATSILEWRVAPDRLDCELCDFLADAWTERRTARAS
jgi:pimeloyl-ACP methyl ester carboxylesterase